MSNFKQLAKATKIVEQIKKLDKEITELDRFAILIVNGNGKADFELKVQDITPKSEPEKNNQEATWESAMDTARYLLSQHLENMSLFSCSSTPKSDKTTLKSELSETASLEIMAILLREKHLKRTELINQLKSYGFLANHP